jgi:hypothetical protein
MLKRCQQHSFTTVFINSTNHIQLRNNFYDQFSPSSVGQIFAEALLHNKAAAAAMFC